MSRSQYTVEELVELNLGVTDLRDVTDYGMHLDIEDFNGWSQICFDQNNIKEYVNLQTGGAFEKYTSKIVHVVVDTVFQSHLSPAHSKDITLTVDIDMVGMSDRIPMYPSSTLDAIKDFTSAVSPMFYGKHLHEISNMILGQYVDASRLKHYIFFSRLYHEGETKTQASLRMREDTRTSFIENVLFQALRCNESIAHLYPISLKDEVFRKRSAAGTISNVGTFVIQEHMALVVDTMRQIIAESASPMPQETSLAQFRDFFFFTHSYGIKQHIPYSMEKAGNQASIVPIVHEAINDLNWNGILDDNVVLDLAINIGVHGHTGLWVAQPDDKRDGHLTTRLLNMFLEGMKIASRRYRHDMFAYISTLGGFRYHARNKVQGDGPCNILSMQAYHTIKTPFYIARRGSSRTSHDISVEQLVFNPSTADYVMNGTRDIFYDIQEMSYPARFELSLRLPHVQYFYDNIHVYVQRILDEQEDPCLVFYETSIVCSLGVHKINALQYMYKSISDAGIGLRLQDDHLMTLICYISVIFSGLVARPDSFAYQQRFIQFLYNRAEYNSALLLCPRLLYFDGAFYLLDNNLSTFARIQRRTMSRLNRPNQLYSVPDVAHYFRPVNYRVLDELSNLLFGMERMILDVKETYSVLREPAASIANMLIVVIEAIYLIYDSIYTS
ncbi:hypothetical protein INT47_011812 [Mucor saturninus]|uniref:Uncharacterized protein n=1 Tax=Mucor saturninus TaxID=64648 RepID=A0A8H7RB37_9FUNG|nr:hypothetical protein INT47_011812 [Mucor saturninus]